MKLLLFLQTKMGESTNLQFLFFMTVFRALKLKACLYNQGVLSEEVAANDLVTVVNCRDSHSILYHLTIRPAWNL